MELCLAAQSASRTTAEEHLDEQILSYIEEARTLDGGRHEKQLLNRPAPLTDRLFYAWRRLWEAIGFPSSYAYTRIKLFTGNRLIDLTRAYLEPKK